LHTVSAANADQFIHRDGNVNAAHVRVAIVVRQTQFADLAESTESGAARCTAAIDIGFVIVLNAVLASLVEQSHLTDICFAVGSHAVASGNASRVGQTAKTASASTAINVSFCAVL
jgi:hypothetical protein